MAAPFFLRYKDVEEDYKGFSVKILRGVEKQYTEKEGCYLLIKVSPIIGGRDIFFESRYSSVKEAISKTKEYIDYLIRINNS